MNEITKSNNENSRETGKSLYEITKYTEKYPCSICKLKFKTKRAREEHEKEHNKKWKRQMNV